MDTIFQSSDLAGNRRVEFLQAARSGRARLRDKDGTSLVMLPESDLEWLEVMAKWSTAQLRLTELLRRGVVPTVSDLGELAWLRTFDLEDLQLFVDELHEVLVTAHADRSTDSLDACVQAWRTTARQLEDPLRRKVLLGSHDAEAFTEVSRPDGVFIDPVEGSDAGSVSDGRDN
ncbi:hypothetical protein AB0K00_21705 [Dactylosporangium sp. NPDC049525]|uniref:hypothetical protein n=1 Tax=Dactylosporangium sp. NPDC049525 TaxID=3154730 RepID=UPI003414D5A7